MNYKKQLSDPRWQRKRLEILNLDDWTCQSCLDTTTELHIHHKYYDANKLAWEYEDDAYVTLCADCHLVAEFIKPKGQTLVIATKKFHPKHNCKIISTIVHNTLPNTLSISIFLINADRELIPLDTDCDPAFYSMKNLLENAKKLL